MESQQASMEKAGAGAGRGRERGQRQQPICNLIAKRGQRQADYKCSLASQSSGNGETWVQRERETISKLRGDLMKTLPLGLDVPKSFILCIFSSYECLH